MMKDRKPHTPAGNGRNGQRQYRHSLHRQMLVFCLVFSIILCLLTGIASFAIFRNGMMAQYQSRIDDILRLTLSQIDADDLQTCIESKVESPAFKALTEFADRTRQNCSLDYLAIIKPIREGDTYDVIAVLSGLLPEERAGQSQREDMSIPLLGDRTGNAYPPGFIPVIYDDLINRVDIKYSTSHTDFGSSFDGAVAIRNEQGEGIALLTAGFTVDSIEHTLIHYLLIIFACALLICGLFLIFLSFWFNRRIIAPIRKIEASAGEFARKSHQLNDPKALVLNRPDIHTGDELESLSDTLVTMSEDMKIYVENLLSSAAKMQNMQQEITRISDIAMKDALTGLESKHAFQENQSRLEFQIAAGTAAFGILMVDVNNLKQMNDTYGHEKGDLYLIANSQHIARSFPHSPVYRTGGDEFVVLLEGDDLTHGHDLIQAFQSGMSVSFSVNPWENLCAASGFALYDPTVGDTFETVLARADSAMYENKKAFKHSQAADRH